jgi:hypothetical protein
VRFFSALQMSIMRILKWQILFLLQLSHLIDDKVCKNRNWSATGDWAMMKAASLKAFEAFCSPSAAMI